MGSPLLCPRCWAAVRPPGLWSDSWNCPEHGPVAPLHPAVVGTPGALVQIAARSQVPLWLPWPLPQGWLASGARYAGDEHSGAVATVVALSGPNPIVLDIDDPLAGDLLVVAEQPGVGLAARLAGVGGIDPGDVATGRSDAHLVAAGHETPMWSFAIGSEDDGTAGVAYVGEALGEWLWVLAWPRPASAVLLERFELIDVRDPAHILHFPYGALTPRLG